MFITSKDIATLDVPTNLKKGDPYKSEYFNKTVSKINEMIDATNDLEINPIDISILVNAIDLSTIETSTTTYSETEVENNLKWVLNETINGTDEQTTFDCGFTSNNTHYDTLNTAKLSEFEALDGSEITVVNFLRYGEDDEVYMNEWIVDEVYRTIVFDEAPTGELLLFLTNNGSNESLN